MYQGDRPDLTDKINLVAQRQRRSQGTLATDVVARSSYAAKGDVVTGHGNNDPQAVRLGDEGTVLTAAPAEPGGVRWAPGGGFPGPNTGIGVFFVQVFAAGGRFQFEVRPLTRGKDGADLTGLGTHDLTGMYGPVSWDFTDDPSTPPHHNLLTMLEPGIWSFSAVLLGITSTPSPGGDDLTKPWNFARIGTSALGTTDEMLMVPPLGQVIQNPGGYLVGYPSASCSWTRPYDAAVWGFDPNVFLRLSLDYSHFTELLFHGELVWLGPLS